MRPVSVVLLICFVQTVYSRDFYMGMFRKNDFLVAADELHKPRLPSRFTWAQYGRVFKCPITYFRVVDRLGTNVMPRIEILRGGLRMKYIVVRLSVYNRPISVNIYVGCENKKKFVYPKRAKTTTTTAAAPKTKADKGGETSETTADGAGGDGATTAAGGDGGNPTEADGDGGNPTEEGGDGGNPTVEGGDGGNPAPDGGGGNNPAPEGGEDDNPAPEEGGERRKSNNIQ